MTRYYAKVTNRQTGESTEGTFDDISEAADFTNEQNKKFGHDTVIDMYPLEDETETR